jgi:USP6 N-terminal-like protein
LPKIKDANERKQAQVQVEREKKWNKMTNSWKNFKGTEKLRKRIYKGIPDSFRSRVWGFLLDIESSRQQQKGKYEV